MKSIVVMLEPEAARAWHTAAGKDAKVEPIVTELKKLADSLGVQLTPVHPNATHEMLLPFFSAGSVPDERAEGIAEGLRNSRGVESAYVQPDPGPA
jgi:hypothetical protein